MAGFKIDILNLASIQKQIKDTIPKEVEKEVNAQLAAFGEDVVRDAIMHAPTDEGHIRSSISSKMEGSTVEIVVATNYAAYLEFGTRSFASAYVSSLPADWQTFAATFKGPGGGTFAEMVERLTEWVHRKGLGTGHRGNIGVTGTYSVKTRRRTGSKPTQQNEDRQAAYLIARSIMRKGIKAHPFLYPAIQHNKALLIERLKDLFN